MNEIPATDESLVLDARRDPEAFTEFYRRHAPALLGYLVRRTGDAELGADLTAETFACALEGAKRFDPARGSAASWLFGIARNQLSRSLERGRVERRARARLGIADIRLDDEGFGRIEAFVESDTTTHRIAVAFDGLPEDQRTALTARVVDGKPYDSIARAAGVSQATARKRVSRALHMLRNSLGGQR